MKTAYPEKMLSLLKKYGFEISELESENKEHCSFTLSYRTRNNIDLEEKVITQSNPPTVWEIFTAMGGVCDNIETVSLTEETYDRCEGDTLYPNGVVGETVTLDDIKHDIEMYKIHFDNLMSALWDKCPRLQKGGESMVVKPCKQPVIEWVVDTKNFNGYAEGTLYDGYEPYAHMTKEQFVKQGFTILSDKEYDNFVVEFEQKQCGDWKEIDKQTYEDALNILPPVQYSKGGFFISEAYFGQLHDFYQQKGDKYYTCLQRITTPRKEILDSLDKYLEPKGKHKDTVKEKE